MIPPRVCEGIIDQLSALNQAESRSRSENIEFGIRHRMRSGKTLLNHTRLLGYTKGPDGGVQIVSEEAEIVRMIFDLYVQGSGVSSSICMSAGVFLLCSFNVRAMAFIPLPPI